jgi:hypothetical protein
MMIREVRMRGPGTLVLGVLLVGACSSGGEMSMMDMAASPDLIMLPSCATPMGTVSGPKLVSTPNPQSYVSELGGAVAVTPDQSRVLVTFGGNYMLDSSDVQGAFTLSTDGGNSFGAIGQLPIVTATISRTLVSAADPQGNLWVLTNPFSIAGGSMILYEMAAGASTFNAGVHVEDPTPPNPADPRVSRPWVIIRADGQPLVTWDYAQLEGIRAGTTTDGGMTWSRATVVSNSNLVDLGQPCQAKSGGRVWVVYLTGSTSQPISVRVHFSDDGGVTWPAANTAEVDDPADGPASYAQPYCVSDGPHLWVLYGVSWGDPLDLTVKNLQRSKSLKLAVSTDGGATFTRTDAHDPAVGQSFFAPNLALESSGALDLVYYAGATVGDTTASLVRSRAADGQNFCSAVPIQTGLTLSVSGYGTGKSIGRFVGQTLVGTTQYLAYVDNSGTDGHVAFAKVTP